jgi:hypothetical protein
LAILLTFERYYALKKTMIFVDAHVHIYDCFDLDIFFDSALENFQAAGEHRGVRNQPCSYMLLLTEGTSQDWFNRVTTKLKTGGNFNNPAKKWTFSLTDESSSLTASRDSSSGEIIYVVAGRQIVSAERIEVLALFCDTIISNGLSLIETVDAIQQLGGSPVLPWGAGKWFGKRGEILRDFIAGHDEKGLFLGDNGGRPRFWPTPVLFDFAGKKGFSLLPGTDPLPIPREARRVGSFGFCLDSRPLDLAAPSTFLRELLISGQETIYPFGKLQDIRSFFINQMRLRFRSLLRRKK